MWPITNTRVTYENPWIEVREDEVERPDGASGIYGVVTLRRPAVFVVALTDADEVLLVTIDRHTTGTTIEIPAGGVEEADDLLGAAKRELQEETGYEASEWRELGMMNALNGVCRAREHVFLARGLTRVDQGEGRDEEGISQVRAVPWGEVLAMVGAGEIRDGETIASLMIAAIALGRVS